MFERANGTRFEMAWVTAREPFSGTQIVMIEDISARKMLEQEREQLLSSERAARLEAEHATRAKDDFLAMLSHELRNPLASILGWTAVLQRSTDGKAGCRRRRCHRSSGKVAAATDFGPSRPVGDLGREAQPPSADPGSDRSRSTTRLRCLRRRPPRRTSRCVDRSSTETERVRGDPGRLQQVLWNLLSNALKFTLKGGTIEIDVCRERDSLLVSVRDTGSGIRLIFSRTYSIVSGKALRRPAVVSEDSAGFGDRQTVGRDARRNRRSREFRRR